MRSLVDQEYWDDAYAAAPLVHRHEPVPFTELFDRYLPVGGTCFEVGCYPGDFLVHLGRRFGYAVNGIDATPGTAAKLPAHLRAAGVEVGDVLEGDVFATEVHRTYDVVCSFGFVEHFDDVRSVLARHAELVAPAGTLVVSTPNFRRGQYVLHRLLDAENLRRHSTAAMDTAVWSSALRDLGFEILHAGPAGGTCAFWVDHPRPARIRSRIAAVVSRGADAVSRRVDRPNAWLSPHLICFARRAEEA